MPDFIFQCVAAELAEELRQHRLQVCKLRSRDGWIRCVVTSNPDWYQRLCRGYMSRRRRFPRPRTIIKRCDTLRALDRLANGMNCGPAYYERLAEVITQEALNRGHWSHADDRESYQKELGHALSESQSR